MHYIYSEQLVIIFLLQQYYIYNIYTVANICIISVVSI